MDQNVGTGRMIFVFQCVHMKFLGWHKLGVWWHTLSAKKKEETTNIS